ncbi:CapA family protein [Synergistaceae bacterium OttesenSCG-928-I11]|nr:CapA family protein [Synergistaceae bacterium OttesenSCG-928-I11]
MKFFLKIACDLFITGSRGLRPLAGFGAAPQGLFAALLFLLYISSPAEASRVVFLGDVMMHEQQLTAARTGDDWNFARSFRAVRPLLEDALVVANLETVLAGGESGYSGRPPFNAPDALAPVLAESGVDILTLSNNHILDRGPEGAMRTARVAEEAGMLPLGLEGGLSRWANPLVVEHGGFRWAFVSLLDPQIPGAQKMFSSDVRPAPLDETSLLHSLRAAREASPDFVVACVHWGEEYRTEPSDRQRDLAKRAIENGADIVIGTHPHVLQPVEMTQTARGVGFVAYSLGNFISHQRTPPRERSVALAVDVSRTDGAARIVRVSVATLVVRAIWRGRYSVEVEPAAMRDKKNMPGVGADVLDFLGVSHSPDARGFHTVWGAEAGER